jgi:hypothetical protein
VEYLLALGLLLAPPDAPAPDPALFSATRLPLQVLAVEWEILDPREVRYMLARQEDFSSDLNLLRRRNAELAGAPLAADAGRFPERTTVNELLAFNRAYRQHLEFRQPGEPARFWELRAALQETDHLYQVWDAVRDARSEYYYITVRRQALNRLRMMLGEPAYYAGELPPCVPTWRFTPISD